MLVFAEEGKLESQEKNPRSKGENQLRDMKPGARFSKAPETFRARKAFCSYLYLKNREVYRPETLNEKRAPGGPRFKPEPHWWEGGAVTTA